MYRLMTQTCRSDSESYTDYTDGTFNPYILEALCFNGCRASYTDYTDFRKKYTRIYTRIFFIKNYASPRV